MATKSTKDTKAFFVIYVPFVAKSLWALVVGCWALVVGRWALGVGCWAFRPLLSGTGLPSFFFPDFLISNLYELSGGVG
jgi:hypothetical protein